MANTLHNLTLEGGERLESELLRDAHQGLLGGRIVIKDWAGGIPEEKARFPYIRIGERWVSALWLIPIGFLGLLMMIAVAQQLRAYPWMRDFIAAYPGTAGSYAQAIDSGFPWWLRLQHFLNLVFMLFVMRAGLQILADHPRLYLDAGSTPGTDWFRMRGPIPADRINPTDPHKAWTAKDDSVALPAWLGIPGFRHSIGLARWIHFSFVFLWLINGAVFYALLFTTGEWRRLVPTSLKVFPNALSTAIQYASLDFPASQGFVRYNGLQMLVYFITVFVAPPILFVAGLLQAPSIAARFGLATGALNRQVARTVHFFGFLWMAFFIITHVTMVWITGLVNNLNHITLGTNTNSWWAVAIAAVGIGFVVVLWIEASPFTIRYPRVVRRAGGFLVGWIKAFMEWGHPRATYSERHISSHLWPNGTLPDSEEYSRLLEGGFADFKLRVFGKVRKPVEISYAELKAMPKREQITQHYCIQGWSGIAKWGGIAMSDILDIVQPDPEAKWVVFYSFASGPERGLYYDCHKIEHMRHNLTILAYEMNGEPLSELHGAPLRLRNELELGFKQVKWIQAVEFVEDFRHLGGGEGGYNEDQEFYGYRMPI